MGCNPHKMKKPFMARWSLCNDHAIPRDRIRGLILVTCVSRNTVFMVFTVCSRDNFWWGVGGEHRKE